MSVIESVATAISYDRLVRAHLQASARRHGQSLDFSTFLEKANQEPNRNSIAENTYPTYTPVKEKGEKGDKGKKGA